MISISCLCHILIAGTLQYISDIGEVTPAWLWDRCTPSLAQLVGYHPLGQFFAPICVTSCDPGFHPFICLFMNGINRRRICNISKTLSTETGASLGGIYVSPRLDRVISLPGDCGHRVAGSIGEIVPMSEVIYLKGSHDQQNSV